MVDPPKRELHGIADGDGTGERGSSAERAPSAPAGRFWGSFVGDGGSVPASLLEQLEGLPTPGTVEEAVSSLQPLGFEPLPPPPPRRTRPRPGPQPPPRPVAVRLTGPPARLRAAAWSLNRRWAAAGIQVYFASNGFNGFPAELGLLATADREDVLRCEGTRAFGPGQEALFAFLRELQATDPFVLPEVQAAALQGYFLAPVKDPDAVADRMLAACPAWGYGETPASTRAGYRDAVAQGLLELCWDDPR